MKNLIDWLISIEDMAGILYSDASEYFKHDQQLSKILTSLAEDETLHFHALGSAERYLEKQVIKIKADLIVDDVTKKNIESLFKENAQLLANNKLTKKDIIHCIGQTEFSEWNDLFLYVMNSLKSYSKHFQYVASEIQNHKKQAESILIQFNEGNSYLDKIKKLPSIWENKILIVDDSELILDLFVSLFENEYLIDTAKNGKEGLGKVKKKFYNLIISDIDMPIMNGIKFFKEVSKLDNELQSRFIYFSGFIQEENMKFILKNGLEFIGKPANLNVLRSKVKAMLSGE